MPSKLYGRIWNVSVGTTDISALRCEFSVKKTLKPEPNTASLRIYNLAPVTRRAFSDPKGVKVRIEAGYGDRLSQVYLGDVRALLPGEQAGADVITELTSGDGEKAMQGNRLAIPVGPKAPLSDVLRTVCKALGVGQGNVATVAAALAARGVSVFPRGTVITGSTARALTDLCRSAGLEWSIQDGALQILDVGQGLDTFPYVISADTGMLGAPKLSSDGKLGVETLMLPDLRPGLRIEMQSKEITGIYRILEIETSGDTHGSKWWHRLVCEKSKVKK